MIVFLLHNAAFLIEKQQIQIWLSDLTWPVLELTIYYIRGENVNHYTTDAVLYDMILLECWSST
jgi:hypothetical protein